jgi:formylglycine-generating enzyme required for sulfatase activity
LRKVDVELGEGGKGLTVKDVCRRIEISEQAYYYRQRQKYGPMNPELVKGLGSLQKDSQRQRKIIADQLIELACGDGVTMKCRLIPAGQFMMGSKKPKYEGPVHEVTISVPFYMGIYPVTQAQYEAVRGKNPSDFKGDHRPVENVSWNDALAFCEELSSLTNRARSLPSEAQWEYACRAGSKTRYSFGDSGSDLDAYGWYEANSGGETHPVGQKCPNAWGLYDMHGNVWEWCEDHWHDTYRNAPADGCAWDGRDTSRVVRGGCCFYDSWNGRSSRRDGRTPDCRRFRGFRVVVSVSPSVD